MRTIPYIYKKNKIKKKFKATHSMHKVTNTHCLVLNFSRFSKILTFLFFIFYFQVFQINFGLYQTIINYSGDLIILIVFLTAIWLSILIVLKSKHFWGDALLLQWVAFVLVLILYKENMLFMRIKGNSSSISTHLFSSSELVQGPALYHGILFLVTSAIFIKLNNKQKILDIKANKKSSMQANNHSLRGVFSVLFLYSFAVGAYWAFFSDVWGYWFNWDPVELFLIFLILFSIAPYHMQFSKNYSQYLKISNVFAFYTLFLWCLRLGYLNSRHSSSQVINYGFNVSYANYFLLAPLLILIIIKFMYTKNKPQNIFVVYAKHKPIKDLYILCFILTLILFLPVNGAVFWKFIIVNNLLIVLIFFLISLLYIKFCDSQNSIKVWSNGHLLILLIIFFGFGISQSHVYSSINANIRAHGALSSVCYNASSKSFWSSYSQLNSRNNTTNILIGNVQKRSIYQIDYVSFINQKNKFTHNVLEFVKKSNIYITNTLTQLPYNESSMYNSYKMQVVNFVKSNALVKFDSMFLTLCCAWVLTSVFCI